MRIVANSELSVLEATDMLEVMVAQGLWRQTIIDEEDREPCRSSHGGDGLGGCQCHATFSSSGYLVTTPRF